MKVRALQRSFGGGEVTPEFWGRIDDAKYQTGLATCRNFLVKPQGPVENRPGTQFVHPAKHADKAARLIPFTYSTTQTMVLEFGDGYLRFHTQGAYMVCPVTAIWLTATAYTVGDLVVNSGTAYYCVAAHTSGATFAGDVANWYAQPAGGEYELPTTYAEADLSGLRYVQSADVLTLVHTAYAPAELRRLSATKWVLSPISFASPLAAPTGVSASATGGTGTDYRYVVTAVTEFGRNESEASAEGTCNGNVYATGAYNDITWSAVTGADRYYVYKHSGGMFGYLGQTTDLTFRDDNIAADISRTPPIAQNLFAATGDYPGAVSYFEQRRAFAGTINAPQNIWMTKSGTEADMSYSLPIRDDDSIQFRVAAREANTIRHIVPLSNMLLLTSGAEWRVTSVNSDAITPSTISVSPQSYIGANDVTPIIVANNVIYATARGGHLREMSYTYQANGYVSGDLSLRAPHLFDGYDIVDMAYAKAPYPIVWCVSSSGDLLGFTYLPEQNVGAWHRHDTTLGAVESVAVVAEGADDVLYAVVRREINGAQVRYIERLRPRAFAAQKDAYFVDCGLTYTGVAADTISGLDHLEGEEVAILGDGAVFPRQVVTGGAVTLDQEVSTCSIGLPIEADLQTLPFAFETADLGQGHTKNVNSVVLRVYRSGGIFAGPAFDKLVEAKQRTTEEYGQPPLLKTDEVRLALTPTWASAGQVCIRQADPLPLTVVSMVLDVEIGD